MSKGRVLVVDDEEPIRLLLKGLLVDSGYVVDLAADGLEALEIAQEHPPDVVLTDLKMPNLDGMGLIAKLREQNDDLPIVVATAVGDTRSAVEAMRAGAYDYLTKPVDFDVLVLSLQRAMERRSIAVEAENLKRQLAGRSDEGLRGLIGTSLAMQKIYRLARQVSAARATVLITGESGTGKGELARAIHALSPRASAPLVTLHCSTIPEALLESELFGHERGSFTGAEKRRVGRFEQAHDGTLFLDEIGEISPTMQVKLLRVLQERSFERVGGNETINVDVKLIAATNRDLAADVRAGKFREDLYYRLNVVHLEMPPLRLRDADVLLLATHFLRKFAAENAKPIDDFSDPARTKILNHRWPGNVRELENAIERAVVLSETALVDVIDLEFDATHNLQAHLPIPGSTMAELERYAILAALEATGGSTMKAAELLDVSVRTIQYRLTEYGMSAKETIKVH